MKYRSSESPADGTPLLVVRTQRLDAPDKNIDVCDRVPAIVRSFVPSPDFVKLGKGGERPFSFISMLRCAAGDVTGKLAAYSERSRPLVVS